MHFLCIDSADFDISPQFITFLGDKDTLPVQVLLTNDKILQEKERFIATVNITGNVTGSNGREARQCDVDH